MNRKLWTLLVSDIADPNNKLSNEIKANIFYLGEFVEYHSRKVISENSTLTPLIDINLALLRGLNDQGKLA